MNPRFNSIKAKPRKRIGLLKQRLVKTIVPKRILQQRSFEEFKQIISKFNSGDRKIVNIERWHFNDGAEEIWIRYSIQPSENQLKHFKNMKPMERVFKIVKGGKEKAFSKKGEKYMVVQAELFKQISLLPIFKSTFELPGESVEKAIAGRQMRLNIFPEAKRFLKSSFFRQNLVGIRKLYNSGEPQKIALALQKLKLLEEQVVKLEKQENSPQKGFVESLKARFRGKKPAGYAEWLRKKFEKEKTLFDNFLENYFNKNFSEIRAAYSSGQENGVETALNGFRKLNAFVRWLELANDSVPIGYLRLAKNRLREEKKPFRQFVEAKARREIEELDERINVLREFSGRRKQIIAEAEQDLIELNKLISRGEKANAKKFFRGLARKYHPDPRAGKAGEIYEEAFKLFAGAKKRLDNM